jgi:hypothetical protein
MNKNEKKASQLGMPQGTASNRLRKNIIFMLLKMQNLNFCHQCGAEIESVDDLSIEHKIPWLDSEDLIKLFFDLDNIAFSHHSCNSAAARHREIKHPSRTSYLKNRCRCQECIKANSDYKRSIRTK